MRSLLEEVDELLSRARYMEEVHPKTSITEDYWTRLGSVCEQAQRLCPETLKNVTPNESNKSWGEALVCLEAVNEVLTSPKA
jgi:hypothetical protein